MLSRVAESIYWMNRYIERAEDTARVIDVNLNLMLDLPASIQEQWGPLVEIMADAPLFAEHYGSPSRRSVIDFLTFDGENPNSIFRCLHSARENARSVREIISTELWEQINAFYLVVQSPAFRSLASADPSAFFRRVRTEAHLFGGITDATMSRGEAWHFGRLGRMLERADKTSRLLDVKYFILLPAVADVGTPFDSLQWAAVLRSASALEMYRKRHHRIDPERVAEFLVLDREFPRSIWYCLANADDSLRAISGSPGGSFQNRAEQLLGRMRARLSYERIQDIVRDGLHEFLDGLQLEMNRIGDAIFATFFAARAIEFTARQTQSVEVSRE